MNPSRPRRLVKLLVLSTALITFGWLIFLPGTDDKVAASASGPSPSHTGAPLEATCTSCHSDFPVNSGTGNVSISGIPANYLPGQQIPVTVTTTEATGVVYGFQFTAIDPAGRRIGTFSLPSQTPAQMQIVTGLVGPQNIERRYVQHTVDGIIPTQFGSKTWNFTWTAPPTRVGRIGFYVAGNGANSDGSTSGDYIYTRSAATLSGSAISSFDGDGKADVAVYRPSSGVWYSLNSTNGNFQATQFGIAEDRIVAGDYDGDGITDRAVWRPSTGVWYVQKSTGGFIITQFGLSSDIPVPGDYDGDLKYDLAVWRPSTGVWYITRSSNGTYDIRQFGLSTDKTAQGDYDGDAKTDLAVWRPSTGVWYIWRSSDSNYFITTFGLNGDVPVQSDYDGDGRTDIALYRPSDRIWYINRSTQGFFAMQFGLPTDRPAPADFDGDGASDITLYRDGVWYIFRSTDFGVSIYNFGLAEDKPIPGGYISQ